MPMPIERKNPAWRRGLGKGEFLRQENSTLAAFFSQGNICHFCHWLRAGRTRSRSFTYCALTGEHVRQGDAACENFFPTAGNSHLTSDSGGGIVGFPNYERLAAAFGFSPMKSKMAAFLISCLFAVPLWLRRELAEHVPHSVSGGRPFVSRGACSAFLRLLTVNLKEVRNVH